MTYRQIVMNTSGPLRHTSQFALRFECASVPLIINAFSDVHVSGLFLFYRDKACSVIILYSCIKFK